MNRTGLKRILAFVLLLATLAGLFALSFASAEEAPLLTKKCKYRVPSGTKKANLCDGKNSTSYKSYQVSHPYIDIQLPSGKAASGVCIYWNELPPAWELQALQEDGSWVTVSESTNPVYAHEYMAVPDLNRFRVYITQEEPCSIEVQEVKVIGQGDMPADFQHWQTLSGKADMLLLVAHPDDEYIFMGGLLPYYAGELGKNVIVCYMTYGNNLRRTELLNGLWHAGVTLYPVIGEFGDKFFFSTDDAYDFWGEAETVSFLTDVIKQYCPDVIVTHDVDGEYGHGAHSLCADLAQKCVQKAAEGENAWNVKKLYLHLYPENQIVIDWKMELSAFGGKTALQVAKEAFRYHNSQQGGQAYGYVFDVRDRDRYDSSAYGLAYSTVGDDVLKNDFFENIQ